MYRVLIRVFYPVKSGTIVLRTEQGWDLDLEPTRVSRDRSKFEFEVTHVRPYLDFKPYLRDESGGRWAEGTNEIALMTKSLPHDVYPCFLSGLRGRITDVMKVPSKILGRKQLMRLYLPAGYTENPLKRYPVLYMHDGKNLFFPEEAFLGQEWEIDENLDRLDAMNVIDEVIVVGLFAGDREMDYTQPGYEPYGRSLVREIKPWLEGNYRTLGGPRNTGVMGSSRGGVVSFFLGWQWPEVFGNVAALSSTFSNKDDLIERVRREPVGKRRGLKIYLDSGWPGDNYEVTLSMAAALLERGFIFGRDLLHLAFPLAAHTEAAWAARVHLPLQLFSGKLRRAAELRHRLQELEKAGAPSVPRADGPRSRKPPAEGS